MSPIRVKVDPSHDASKVKAEGPGLSRSGMSAAQNTDQSLQTVMMQNTDLIGLGVEFSKELEIKQIETIGNKQIISVTYF